MRSAAILIVGDEVLAGEVPDENGPFLLRVFAEAGVGVTRAAVVPDRTEAIVEEVRHLRGHADGVVVSGGIGPTHDDLTRPAVAEALGVPLVPDPEAERSVRGFSGENPTEADLAMARLPRGSSLLVGRSTGTVGFHLSGVFVLPGVPALFRDLARDLPRHFTPRPVHREVLETARREGEIAATLAEAQGRALDVQIGSYPIWEGGRWRVRVVLRGADHARVALVASDLRRRL